MVDVLGYVFEIGDVVIVAVYLDFVCRLCYY